MPKNIEGQDKSRLEAAPTEKMKRNHFCPVGAAPGRDFGTKAHPVGIESGHLW
jgi:hypothetical protein